ncbi:hypothetical protein [Amycolatopsis magusensis]|uniref:Uncharacterized protein n=1 Tax=Amycolatopsis magusensis TaxID=882444 RepID=A0ABS4PTG6_9PSEU|nr:hypothetical protein [Amycolatopsis magusensis]MBP2182715.1 hypothetical protein [Amycolatopsis magusensis]
MARRIGGAGGGSDAGGGGAKKVVAAAVAAGVLAGGGGVTGAFSSSGGASTGEAALGRTVKARKADSKSAARRGNADEAWQKMGMRTLRRVAKQDLNCVANSFDDIRAFFVKTPCALLDRTLFAVADDNGGSIVISVAWVKFHSRADARRFQSLIDQHGNGDVRPLATSMLGVAEVRFTGLNYDSDIQGGRTVAIGETEQLDGSPDETLLDALAEVAVQLPSAGRP